MMKGFLVLLGMVFSGAAWSAIQFPANTAVTNEGAGQLQLSIVRTGASFAPATVNYATISGSAVSGRDFTFTSGTLLWAEDDAAAKTISIPILDNDVIGDAARSFTVRLTDATGDTLGDIDVITVTILDDDDAGADNRRSTVRISTPVVSINEGAGSASIVAQRDGDLRGRLVLSMSTVAGTAVAGRDFAASSGELVWQSGQGGQRTFTVGIIDNSTVDPSRSFQVVADIGFTDAPEAPELTVSSATVQIIDNDVANPGAFRVSAITPTVPETAGSASVRVTRDQGGSGAVGVTLRTDGAGEGVFHGAVSRTLTWADGDNSPRTVSIPIIDRPAAVTGPVTFRVVLESPTGAPVPGISGDGSALITVTDVVNREANQSTIRFLTPVLLVNEGEGQAEVRLTRSGSLNGEIIVSLVTGGGTALPGVDYQTVSGEVRWQNGEGGARTFTVPVIDNETVDGLRRFTVSGNLSFVNTPQPPIFESRTAEIEIIDNDVANPGRIRIIQPDPFPEDGGTLNIEVRRVAGGFGPVSVRLRTLGPGAGVFYTNTTSTLEWGADQNGPRFFSVPIIDRPLLFTGPETFEVVIEELLGSPAPTLDGDERITVTVADMTPEPVDPVVLGLETNRYLITPSQLGGIVDVCAIRSNDEGLLRTLLTAEDDTAVLDNGDYSFVSAQLRFEDGEAKSCTQVSVGPDRFSSDLRFILNLTVMEEDIENVILTVNRATVDIQYGNSTPKRGGGAFGLWVLVALGLGSLWRRQRAG